MKCKKLNYPSISVCLLRVVPGQVEKHGNFPTELFDKVITNGIIKIVIAIN
jgi:hypothetical protein